MWCGAVRCGVVWCGVVWCGVGERVVGIMKIDGGVAWRMRERPRRASSSSSSSSPSSSSSFGRFRPFTNNPVAHIHNPHAYRTPLLSSCSVPFPLLHTSQSLLSLHGPGARVRERGGFCDVKRSRRAIRHKSMIRQPPPDVSSPSLITPPIWTDRPFPFRYLYYTSSK